MSVASAMPTSERETNNAFSQRDLTRIDNIHKELNKLRVLYKSNKRRNNELML